MQEIIKNKCTGCTACANICPHNAIKMIEKNDGFKYPFINQDKCVDCELCKKTCPVLNKKEITAMNVCYVGYAKDMEYKKSASSGGIFSLIANYTLNNNGIVIGAAFNESNMLQHIAISNENELNRLKGSKYLQSDLGTIFEFIKGNIRNKKILFVGTPCQVARIEGFY